MEKAGQLRFTPCGGGREIGANSYLVSIDGREDREVVAGDVVTVAALERPIRFVVPFGAVPFWDLFRRKVELLPS